MLNKRRVTHEGEGIGTRDRAPSLCVRLSSEGWLGIIPFFQFPQEIRKIVYTTNTVESLNMSLPKAIKTRGAFPSEDDAALKVVYLAPRNLAAKWHIIQGWKEALQRFPQQCG
jgi:putative transposase